MYIPSNVPDKTPTKLLPAGEYDFEATNAVDTRSKPSEKFPDGNEMIKLTIKVWDKNGSEHIIWDYLIDIESMWFKSKHFLQSTGNTYENVDIKAINCINKYGKLLLEIQKDKTGKYSDRNIVKDYIVPEILTLSERLSIIPPSLNEDQFLQLEEEPF